MLAELTKGLSSVIFLRLSGIVPMPSNKQVRRSVGNALVLYYYFVVLMMLCYDVVL